MLVKGQSWEKGRPQGGEGGAGLGQEEGALHATVCLACVSLQEKEGRAPDCCVTVPPQRVTPSVCPSMTRGQRSQDLERICLTPSPQVLAGSPLSPLAHLPGFPAPDSKSSPEVPTP